MYTSELLIIYVIPHWVKMGIIKHLEKEFTHPINFRITPLQGKS